MGGDYTSGVIMRMYAETKGFHCLQSALVLLRPAGAG